MISFGIQVLFLAGIHISHTFSCTPTGILLYTVFLLPALNLHSSTEHFYHRKWWGDSPMAHRCPTKPMDNICPNTYVPFSFKWIKFFTHFVNFWISGVRSLQKVGWSLDFSQKILKGHAPQPPLGKNLIISRVIFSKGGSGPPNSPLAYATVLDKRVLVSMFWFASSISKCQ